MDSEEKNHSGNLNLHSSRNKRRLFMLAGHFALLAGIIGVVLPIMPTSPFVILAAYCYARSSKRFYYMLLNNKYFGHYIVHWEQHHCIQRSMKWSIMGMLVLMFSGTIYFFMPTPQMKIFALILGLIAIACVAFIPVCHDKK